MLTLSDHLRSFESLDAWWDRVLTTLCESMTLGYGYYDKVLRDCLMAGF